MRFDVLKSSLLLRFLASAATGLLLVFAYPRFDVSAFAWAALIPLAFLLFKCGGKAAFGWAFVTGTVFFLGSLCWLLPLVAFAGWLAVLGWLALSLYLALFFGAWGWCLSVLHVRTAGEQFTSTIGGNLLLAFLGSCAWVATEIVRSHLFTGFPWNLLGVSQYKNLAIVQFASVTGVYGVSWLVCFVNLCLAITILRLRYEMGGVRTAQRRYRPHLELTIAMLLVVGLMVAGARQLATREKLPSLTVSVVQPNIPQEQKWDEKSSELIYSRLALLTQEAAQSKPDLIVWPETATPKPLAYDVDVFTIITNAVRQSGGYLLAGSLCTQPGVSRSESDPSAQERAWYNSAYLITPQGQLMPPYHKVHLVPFGEFVPLANVFPFMKHMTPIPGSLARGKDLTLFQIANHQSEISQLGVVICFEDVFPDLFRRFVGKGAQVMVNITNDAWYKRSAGPYQHMANSVFRAIENRVSLVRCANTGYSCFIDPYGRIYSPVVAPDKKDIFVENFQRDSVTLRDPFAEPTFYSRHGDVFAWGCLGIAVVAVALLLRKRSPSA